MSSNPSKKIRPTAIGIVAGLLISNGSGEINATVIKGIVTTYHQSIPSVVSAQKIQAAIIVSLPLVLAWLGMIVVLLGGRLIDRWRYRSGFMVAGSLFALASLLSGVSPNFWLFLACRAVLGASMGLCFVVTTRSARKCASSAAKGILMFSFPVGIMLGIVLTWRITSLPICWQVVLMSPALLGFILVLLALGLPNKPRDATRDGKV
jgi:MFS transporter, putative metabolite transport protein